MKWEEFPSVGRSEFLFQFHPSGCALVGALTGIAWRGVHEPYRASQEAAYVVQLSLVAQNRLVIHASNLNSPSSKRGKSIEIVPEVTLLKNFSF